MRFDLFFVATLGLLFMRLATLGAFPLLDTSEARYAEIARLMVESGDWITPWFEPGTPFWGKPPLAFWLSALSFKLFGINEFAARLPHWCLATGTLWLVTGIARAEGAAAPWRPAFLLASTVLFMVAGGAVLTDAALMFSVTLALAAAYHALIRSNARWGLAFFVGLALGLLAKGPLAVLLVFEPVLVLAAFSRRDIHLWRDLPWLKGSALCAALALPWYIAAEWKTPGFFDYFLLGEHVMRYVDAGWQGDLYGSAHKQVRGTIWLHGLAAALPWSLLLPAIIWRFLRQGKAAPATGEYATTFYFLMWMLAPLVFFTLAGNILWTYVLPGLPGFALWLDRCWPNTPTRSRVPLLLGTVTPLAFAAVIFIANDPGRTRSEKFLLAGIPAEATVYYLDQRPFSARFYSRGRAGLVRGEELPALLASARPLHLAVPKGDAGDFVRRYPQAVEVDGNARFVLYLLHPSS